MTAGPEPVMPAVVLPWAAYLIMRDCGDRLLEKAAVLEGSEHSRVFGRQLRQSLLWLQATGDEQRAAHEASRAGEARQSARGGRASATTGSASATSTQASAPAGPEFVAPLLGGLSVGQVAEQLSVSGATVRKLCGNGRLSATKQGRDWVIAQSAVDDYRKWRADR